MAVTALTIEDGTGVPGADAFADESAFAQWYEDNFGSAHSSTVSVQIAAIRRSAAYLSSLLWKGERQFGRSGQTMPFPRSGATDQDGEAIAEDSIPAEVIRAQHLLTEAEIASPGVLTPQISPGEIVKRTKVGALEEEYFANDSGDYRVILTAVQALIGGLLRLSDAHLPGIIVAETSDDLV